MNTCKIAATVWMAAGTACYAGTYELPVVVLDYAGAPRTVLASAAEEARRALKYAGVQTTWTVCRVSNPSPNCIQHGTRAHVQVNILPLAVEGGLLSSEGLGTATKCPAEEGCVLTEVSYRRTSAFAENAEEPVAVVLAYVIAHEIGHLMGMDHSRSGIMKAHFDRHDMQDASAGRLRFSAEDARRLRTAVALWTGATAPTVVAEAR